MLPGFISIECQIFNKTDPNLSHNANSARSSELDYLLFEQIFCRPDIFIPNLFVLVSCMSTHPPQHFDLHKTMLFLLWKCH
jgi:hypothetical protein